MILIPGELCALKLALEEYCDMQQQYSLRDCHASCPLADELTHKCAIEGNVLPLIHKALEECDRERENYEDN